MNLPSKIRFTTSANNKRIKSIPINDNIPEQLLTEFVLKS